MYVRPRKRLGQHFLNDKNIANKIVDALQPQHSGTIIEAGPGTGILTGLLIDRFKDKFIAVEIDKDLCGKLILMFPSNKESIINADILSYDFSNTESKTISLIGNFPYNISSPILFKVLQNKDTVKEVVCMLQKEVAERICAPHGSKTYGILSVLLQTFYDIEYKMTINPEVFNPPPKVKSAVIRLSRNERMLGEKEERLLTVIVKKAFNQRRKMLRNALKEYVTILAKTPYMMKRAEQLSISDYLSIVSELSKDSNSDMEQAE